MVETTILEFYKIRIALDTQILSYLLDKTYPMLNSFIEKLSSNIYVDLVCPRFATYELIGVRKLEHYLRAIHAHSISKKGMMSFSSALKYRYDWSAPELDYKYVFQDIKELVEKDLAKINDDFGIEFEDRNLHPELWKPHQDLTLSSKISKEDSLILLSSTFPNESLKESYLIFLTNDDGFFQGYCGTRKMDSVDEVFETHDIRQPTAYKINAITTPISNKPLNLLKDTWTDDVLNSFVLEFIKEHLLLKAEPYMLGRVASCGNSTNVPSSMLCFELFNSKEIKQNLYLSIISKDLDFVYNHPTKLSDFYNVQKIKSYPYKPPLESQRKGISIKLTIDGNDLDTALIAKIFTTGNLVLIHPDTDL